MKIALIYLSNYKDWPMGGMLNYVNNIIPTLCSSEKIEVDIWGGTYGKERNCRFFIEGKEYFFNRYTSFYTKHKILPNFVWSFLGALVNSYKFRKYDLIFSQTSATTIALKIMHPFKKVIHHQHGFSYKDRPGLARKALCVGHMLAQKLADATLFVASEEEINKHKSEHFCLKNKNFYAIGSPIDYQFINGRMMEKRMRDDGIIKFVYTGRIDAWKNIELMIEAFELYLSDGYKGELTIIGDGPQLEIINEKANKSQYNEKIHIVGRKEFSQIIEYLISSDIFLFPTKGEGISLSLLEAFAAGLPAVSFNVKGVTEFVKNGTTGIVVEEMTSEEFEKGMIKIITQYEEMRSNCMKISSHYERTTIAETIINILLKEYVRC